MIVEIDDDDVVKLVDELKIDIENENALKKSVDESHTVILENELV